MRTFLSTNLPKELIDGINALIKERYEIVDVAQPCDTLLCCRINRRIGDASTLCGHLFPDTDKAAKDNAAKKIASLHGSVLRVEDIEDILDKEMPFRPIEDERIRTSLLREIAACVDFLHSDIGTFWKQQEQCPVYWFFNPIDWKRCLDWIKVLEAHLLDGDSAIEKTLIPKLDALANLVERIDANLKQLSSEQSKSICKYLDNIKEIKDGISETISRICDLEPSSAKKRLGACVQEVYEVLNGLLGSNRSLLTCDQLNENINSLFIKSLYTVSNPYEAYIVWRYYWELKKSERYSVNPDFRKPFCFSQSQEDALWDANIIFDPKKVERAGITLSCLKYAIETFFLDSVEHPYDWVVVWIYFRAELKILKNEYCTNLEAFADQMKSAEWFGRDDEATARLNRDNLKQYSKLANHSLDEWEKCAEKNKDLSTNSVQRLRTIYKQFDADFSENFSKK